MKIKILGSAAYERVPSMFCNCAACKTARENGGKSIRTQAQALIDDKLLIDFGSDNYSHFMDSGADFSAIENLLVTHTHSDHFNKGDFIMRENPYAHDLTHTPLNVYGNKSCGELLTCDKQACGITFTQVGAFETFNCGNYNVTALPASHSTEKPLVYIITDGKKTLFYSLDTALPQQDVYDFVKEKGFCFDAVICDCTMGLWDMRNCGGHMSLLDNITHRENLKAAGAITDKTIWVVTHFSHNALIKDGKGVTHEQLAEIAEKHGMLTAYDGFELNI